MHKENIHVGNICVLTLHRIMLCFRSRAGLRTHKASNLDSGIYFLRSNVLRAIMLKIDYSCTQKIR